MSSLAPAPLVLRLDKGSPLTSAEMDQNLKSLRDYGAALGALFGVSLNPDGTIKAGAINATNLQPGPYWYADLTGEDNAYSLETPVEFDSLQAGICFIGKANHKNTGTSTLEITGDGTGYSGTHNIVTSDGASLAGGEILNNQICVFIYNGTSWQLINPSSVATSAVSSIVAVNGSRTLTPLGSSDTEMANATLSLPSGKRWSWMRIVMSVKLGTIGLGASHDISDVSFEVLGQKMSGGWMFAPNPTTSYGEHNSDEQTIVYTAEGMVPPDKVYEEILTVKVYGRHSSQDQGDIPADRTMYVVAWCQ